MTVFNFKFAMRLHKKTKTKKLSFGLNLHLLKKNEANIILLYRIKEQLKYESSKQIPEHTKLTVEY